MNKLLYVLTAGAAALVMTSGFSGAADQTRPNEEAPPRASENQPGTGAADQTRANQEAPPRTSENQPGDPSAVKTSPEQAKQDQEYMAALKKCDTLKGGEKQKCVDAAQRKFSRM